MSNVFPMGVFKEKFPFRSVTVPVLLSLTKTVAPTIGLLVSMSKTHPDISISLFFMVAVFSVTTDHSCQVTQIDRGYFV